MISSPLFRPGDIVHWRHDLQAGARYDMLSRDRDAVRISPYAGAWISNHAGIQACVDGMTVIGNYVIDGLYGITDTMLQEATRIEKFLAPRGGIEF